MCPPSREAISGLYSNRLYWGRLARTRGWPTIEERADLYRADGRLDHWLRLARKYCPQPGTVIEAGCAPGVLIAELQNRGHRCVGIEPSPDVAAWVSRNMRVDVRTGAFPDDALNLPPCDLFLAFDVLEHVHDPDRFMKEAARLLRPGGHLIVQCPVDRYGRQPPLGELAGRPMFFDDMEHLFVFTDKSLRMLAGAAHLAVASMEEPPWTVGHEVTVFRKAADAS